jgi:hypothetical protein
VDGLHGCSILSEYAMLVLLRIVMQNLVERALGDRVQKLLESRQLFALGRIGVGDGGCESDCEGRQEEK